MAQSSFATWLRKLTVQAQGNDQTDRELLERYAKSRDRDALETLVYRYAGLVHCVCRRILHDAADVDDAVQAVFLVLMKKPHAVRNPGALPAWLHGTARRISLNLRTRNQRRATATTEPMTTDADPHWREVKCCIDEELAALPSKYRNALFRVLLLEETQQQAATELGISLSTLKRRVEIGRRRLQNRLTRRGIQPLLLAGSLTIADTMSAANLARLADQTTTATVTTSATALSLANGVLFTMFQTKLKLWTVGVMLTGVTLGTSAGLVTVQGQGTPGAGAAATKTEKPNDEAKQEATPTTVEELKKRVHELEAANQAVLARYLVVQEALKKFQDQQQPKEQAPELIRRTEELTFTIEKAKLRRDAAKTKIMAAERLRSVNSIPDSEKADALIRIYDAQLELLTADHDQKLAERELAELKKAPLPAEVPAKVAAPTADKMTPEVKAKLEEMMACAKAEMKGHHTRLTQLMEVDFESYYASASRLVHCELQLAGADTAQRLKIMKQQIEFCLSIEHMLKTKVENGLARSSDYERAKFARMEAELQLLQLQQK